MQILVCLLLVTVPSLADWVASYQFGESLLKQGRPDDAVREFKVVLEQRPGDAVILDALGRAEFRAGRYRSAKKHFEQALQVAVDNTALLANLAQTSLALADFSRAEQLLRRALEHEPANTRLWQLLGQVLYKRSHYAEAETAFHRALSNNKDPLIWSDLAALYLAQGNEMQSLELLRRAVAQVSPGQGRARLRANLGVLQWKIGARNDAESSLRAALEEMTAIAGSRHPDNGWILENYAEILGNLGRKAEARSARARAAEIRSAFAGQNNDQGLTVDWRDLDMKKTFDARR